MISPLCPICGKPRVDERGEFHDCAGVAYCKKIDRDNRRAWDEEETRDWFPGRQRTSEFMGGAAALAVSFGDIEPI